MTGSVSDCEVVCSLNKGKYKDCVVVESLVLWQIGSCNSGGQFHSNRYYIFYA